MTKRCAIGFRTLAGAALLAAVVGLPSGAAAAPEVARLDEAVPLYLAQAKTSPDDAFVKAMQLLRRSDGAPPSLADVDRAGHMLMEAGPDAFEKAMNLLSRPNVTSSEITTAKAQMAKGGPDASTQAMNLLRKGFGY